MGKLRIGIMEIMAGTPVKNSYAPVMGAEFASIMPQVLALWCEGKGHEVFLTHYSGHQNWVEPLPDKLDAVFISAFSQSAQVAYAFSNIFHALSAPRL